MKKDISARMRPKLGRLPILPDWSILTGGALLITLILEFLSRGSILGAFRFIRVNPLAFLLNWGLVSCTFAIALLFHKKVFSVTLTTVLWLAFGIADYMVLSRRYHSPLSAVDVFIDKEAFLMLPVYYKWWQIVLGAAVIVAVVTGIVLLAIKTPKYRRRLSHCILRLILCLILTAAILLFAISGGFVSDTLKPSLYDSYRNYGFAYSFLYGFIDTKMGRPTAYSGEKVKNIAGDLNIEVEINTKEDTGLIDNVRDFVSEEVFDNHPEGYTADAVNTIRDMLSAGNEETPNIIFVQLESFFDPLILTSYTIDGDPIPNFRRLMEDCTSGKLLVPTVSGATVNTEFEVLTGCNLDLIGSGEFPFYTVLKDNVTESLATDLKSVGLTATFLHNYTGSFYGRNIVYSNLCFDRFASVEYMDGYEKTPKGWVKDKILTDYILESLTSTEGRDFIFTVTAQTHGEYPAIAGFDPAFAVTDAPGEEERQSMEYYITQLYECDAFIGDLLARLSEYPEDVMVVLYGDHLPGLKFEVEDLADGNLYATNYVIWTNFNLPENDRDIEAYQLGAYALGQTGIDNGVMIKFHQMFMGSNEYLEKMETLQYDMLYGEHYVYGGKLLTRDTELAFGVLPITVTEAYVSNGNLFVLGTGFTGDSRIYVDGDQKDTILVGSGCLIAAGIQPEQTEEIEVCQVAADGTVLSRVTTPGWGIPAEDEVPEDETGEENVGSENAQETDPETETGETDRSETEESDGKHPQETEDSPEPDGSDEEITEEPVIPEEPQKSTDVEENTETEHRQPEGYSA